MSAIKPEDEYFLLVGEEMFKMVLVEIRKKVCLVVYFLRGLGSIFDQWPMWKAPTMQSLEYLTT